jgi:signal peptidase II
LKAKHLRYWLFLVGLTLLLLTLDQTTKWLVRENLAVWDSWAPIPALSKIFTITHVRNTGVAFGTLPGLGWVFMVVNLAVLVGVFIFYPRIPAGNWALRVASSLIVTGDVGNLIDRFRTIALASAETGSFWSALPHGYVTDFMDFKIWPVWNVADLCIVSGTLIVAWTLWQYEKADAARQAAAQDSVPGDQA